MSFGIGLNKARWDLTHMAQKPCAICIYGSRKANSAQKTRLAQPSALKILTATSKIPLAASLRWPS